MAGLVKQTQRSKLKIAEEGSADRKPASCSGARRAQGGVEAPGRERGGKRPIIAEEHERRLVELLMGEKVGLTTYSQTSKRSPGSTRTGSTHSR